MPDAQGHRDPVPVSGPHPFVDPSDPRLGLALGGGFSSGPIGAFGPIAVTITSIGRDRCAAPGCRRPREDPIHWPADGADPASWGG